MVGPAFLILGGSALVGQAARRRGRSFVAWAAVATLLSSGTYLVASGLIVVTAGSPSGSTAAFMSLFTAPAVPLAALAGLLRLIGVRTRRDRWKVHVLGSEGDGERELRIRGEELQLDSAGGASAAIPLSAVERVRADCECIRIEVRDGTAARELVLQIVLPGTEWEERAKLAERVARKLDSRVGEANARLPVAQAIPRA